jgi:hypothetical protein
VDVTKVLADFCQNEPAGLCRYPIDVSSLGDPSKGCSKSFQVRYLCTGGGSEVNKQHQVGPEASGRYALLQCAGATDALRPTLEPDFDRPGSDYRDVEMTGADPTPCQEACVGDAHCRAWTFVKPGVAGPAGHCWLKFEAPAGASRPCCVSGVIR